MLLDVLILFWLLLFLLGILLLAEECENALDSDTAANEWHVGSRVNCF